jgi:hypothetical protein
MRIFYVTLRFRAVERERERKRDKLDYGALISSKITVSLFEIEEINGIVFQQSYLFSHFSRAAETKTFQNSKHIKYVTQSPAHWSRAGKERTLQAHPSKLKLINVKI